LVARNDGERRLHHALRSGEPMEVIQEILDADPDSIRRKEEYDDDDDNDNEGSLPLNVALWHGAPFDVVHLLVDRCPQALED
jgi:hypothetical protein